MLQKHTLSRGDHQRNCHFGRGYSSDGHGAPSVKIVLKADSVVGLLRLSDIFDAVANEVLACIS